MNLGFWGWVILILVVLIAIAILILVIAIKSAKPHEDAIWHDRMRTIFGLPWSFTMYELTGDRIFVQSGFLSMKEEEIRLYRVLDVSFKASLGQRLFGVGSVILETSDKTAGNIELHSVKKARQVKEMIAAKVEEQRDKKRVVNREIMAGIDDMGDDDMDDIN